MEIQNVVAGETKIYNSKGENETIGNVLEHPYDGELYEIKTLNSYEKLRITDEHPVCIFSSGKMVWKDAKDICVGDSIAYVIPEVSMDTDSISIGDCFMYGAILNCGTLQNADTFGSIDLKNGTKKIHGACENYFEECCINYGYNSSNPSQMVWEKTVNSVFRYGEIYNDKGEKRIHKKWLNLPEDKIRYILRGIFETSKTSSSFETTSKDLFFGVQYLLLKIGILCTSSLNEDYYKLCIEEKYFYNTFHSDDIKEYEGKKFVSSVVTGIAKNKYKGTLYDLQMKETHDYMLHQGIVHNGGGKRNGSFAMYLEPWHGDIFEFLDMKKNQGAEESRARDLFYALWISDLFMRRVESGGNWTLMCPHECPGLADVYGEEFEVLYEKYESEGRGRKTFPAQELWFKILESQIETGTPYMLYKDSCNHKSNQKNLGTIRSSNLCCEIVEFSGKHKNGDEETAVCNLASLSLPSFVVKPRGVVRVKMASKIGCTYCALAEAWCVRWEIPYVKVFDEKHDTYPQIFVDTETSQNETSQNETSQNETSQNVHVGGYIDFVKKYPAEYDYEALKTTTSMLTKNLNKVIDKTTYPIPGGESSNKKHRPIGLGVQGLADVFFKMRIPFDSQEAREINVKIFETIYYGAMCESLAISKKREAFVNDGQHNKEFPHKFIPDEIRRIQEGKYVGAYSSFEGSPLSQGKFQFDLWEERHGKFWSDLMYDWDSLRKEIMEHGVRNSLLLAPMPTASTAQILGNTECFEPITSNIYVRRTLAGEFIILNKYLQEDLSSLGMWNESMKNEILLYEGSIQPIEAIPRYIRDIYKTVWDMSQKTIIDMAADRGRFICQSQSMNLFQSDPKFETLTSMYFYAWRQGLKTGLYYLRTKPKGKAQAFTLKPQQQQKSDGYEVCESCSG
jgi:ribonucleotide reductase alpha subunit